MAELEKYIHDDENGLDYILVGDYYLPAITIAEGPEVQIGMWGLRHKVYLKEKRSGLYTAMLWNGTLDQYLMEVDQRAEDMAERLTKAMEMQEGVTEELKERDWLEWVRKVNLIKERVEKFICSEVIYII